MKDRHLIALDLDGTLLTDEKTISPKNKQILKQVEEEGHVVMIATGRPFRSSEIYYKELGLKTPIVNFNGAFVHHPQNREWGYFHEPLDLKTVQTIVENCFSYSVHNIVAEVLDHLFVHYHDEKLLDVFSFGNPEVTEGDLREYLKDDPTSLLIHTDLDNINKIRGFLAEAHAEVVEHRSWGHPWPIVEINKKGINKAVGLKKVADFYDIPQDRIIAFGDEDNDLEMLEFAGYGVAMGNAINPAKEVAKDITLTNNEDGVGAYLKKKLLG